MVLMIGIMLSRDDADYGHSDGLKLRGNWTQYDMNCVHSVMWSGIALFGQQTDKCNLFLLIKAHLETTR